VPLAYQKTAKTGAFIMFLNRFFCSEKYAENNEIASGAGLLNSLLRLEKLPGLA
jgi:hypothetical protein